MRELIKPVFLNLSDDDLLKRCLHGKTQNNNESLNNMLWMKCPKAIFVGKDVLEMAACSAILAFNDGAKGILNVFAKLGLNPGRCSLDFLYRSDVSRVAQMKRKSEEGIKLVRKKQRNKKKGFEDKNEKQEPDYGAGLF